MVMIIFTEISNRQVFKKDLSDLRARVYKIKTMYVNACTLHSCVHYFPKIFDAKTVLVAFTRCQCVFSSFSITLFNQQSSCFHLKN